MIKLDKEDSELRYRICAAAVKVLEEEDIELPRRDDAVLADFALEYQYENSSGENTRRGKLMLRERLNDGVRVFDWVKSNYSMERLKAMYDFSEYCYWLNAKGVVQHFGELLNIFMTLRGDTPKWCTGVAFHEVLHAAYVSLHAEYRTNAILEWLNKNWDEAVRLFEYQEGTLRNFPHIQGVELSHVHTQYKRERLRRARQYLAEHPEVKHVRGYGEDSTRGGEERETAGSVTLHD